MFNLKISYFGKNLSVWKLLKVAFEVYLNHLYQKCLNKNKFFEKYFFLKSIQADPKHV